MLFPRDYLVAALHWRDICYLAPTPQGHEPHLTDEELIVGLAGSRDGRLRFALAALLLRHPDMAPIAENLAKTRAIDLEGSTERHELPVKIPDAVWDEIRRQYLAAMYLQRLWRTRLRMCLGDSSLIPERFTKALNLPSPDELNGERGLRALTDDSAFNDWSSYEQVVEMLCEQPCRAEVPAPETTVPNELSAHSLNPGLETRDAGL